MPSGSHGCHSRRMGVRRGHLFERRTRCPAESGRPGSTLSGRKGRASKLEIQPYGILRNRSSWGADRIPVDNSAGCDCLLIHDVKDRACRSLDTREHYTNFGYSASSSCCYSRQANGVKGVNGANTDRLYDSLAVAPVETDCSAASWAS